MKVREAILLLQAMPPDAELTISAPMSCSRNPADAGRVGNLVLPTCGIAAGTFHPGSETMTGKRWISLVGTDAWDQNFGLLNAEAKECARFAGYLKKGSLHEEALRKLGEMTPQQVFEISVRAGIHNPNGTLTKEYGGE